MQVGVKRRRGWEELAPREERSWSSTGRANQISSQNDNRRTSASWLAKPFRAIRTMLSSVGLVKWTSAQSGEPSSKRARYSFPAHALTGFSPVNNQSVASRKIEIPIVPRSTVQGASPRNLELELSLHRSKKRNCRLSISTSPTNTKHPGPPSNQPHHVPSSSCSPPLFNPSAIRQRASLRSELGKTASSSSACTRADADRNRIVSADIRHPASPTRTISTPCEVQQPLHDSPSTRCLPLLRDSQQDGTSRVQAQHAACPTKSRGFWNLGNNLCFMNSVLQSLAHCPSFCDAIRHDVEGAGSRCEENLCNLCRMGALLQELSSAKAHGPVHPPLAFLQCMGLEPVSARGRLVDQQDAHEFLRCFIEALMACSRKHLARSDSASSQDGASLSVESIFDIGVRTSIRCSRCKTVSGRAESILDVSLAIANEPAGTSIVSLLDRVAEAEVLQGENAYACDSCAAKVHATKTTDFLRMPRIFVLHLKRFDNSGAKIDAGVVFPETLAFKKRLHYDLRALVVHYGRTCRSGHYTVFVRKGAVLHEDGTKSTWEEISDDVVSDAPWSRVQAQEPYLLLYERRT